MRGQAIDICALIQRDRTSATLMANEANLGAPAHGGGNALRLGKLLGQSPETVSCDSGAALYDALEGLQQIENSLPA